MQPLLHTPDSVLARTLRYALAGLKASLEAALHDAPHDPGATACRRLLQELDGLLTSPDNVLDALNSLPLSPPLDVPVPARPATTSGLLKPLLTEMQDDHELRAELGGPFQPRATSDDALWREIQFLLLRVSNSQVERWRERAQAVAAGIHCSMAWENADYLPFDSDQPLFPGLRGAINASGLCLSKQASLHEQVAEILSQAGPVSDDIRFLGQTVSLCLRMIEIDASLCHALETVYRFGIQPLNKQSREFKQALLNAYKRVCQVPTDSVETFKARLDLDEAIHSLVHQPPAQRNSWWGELRQKCRNTLFTAAQRRSNEVQFRDLPTSYKSARTLTGDNDIALDVDGSVGEVLASLRVWAQLAGRVYPGRAIYRS